MDLCFPPINAPHGLGLETRGELEHLGFGEASAGWAQALREL